MEIAHHEHRYAFSDYYLLNLLDGRVPLDRAEYPTPSTNATHHGDFGPSSLQLPPTTLPPSNDDLSSTSDQADPFFSFATDGDGDTPFGGEGQQAWSWDNVLGDYSFDGTTPIQKGPFDYSTSGDQSVPPDYPSAACHNADVGAGMRNYQGL